MHVFLLFFIGMICIALAAKLAEKALEFASKLCKLLGIKESIFGFVFISIATSLPELSIAVFSFSANTGELSYGNLFGALVVNLTLLFGLLLWRGISIERKVAEAFSKYLFFPIIVAIFIFFFPKLSWSFGIFLILMYFVYANYARETYSLLKVKLGFLRIFEISANLLWFILSFIGVAFLCNIAVNCFSEVAEATGIMQSFIGSTLIAIETSLPEIFITLNALRKKGFVEISVGDLIGSSIVNVTLLLGILLLISPITVGVMETVLAFFAALSSYLASLALERNYGKRFALLLWFIFTCFIAALTYLQFLDFTK